jgi:Fe-S-cluster containining protein
MHLKRFGRQPEKYNPFMDSLAVLFRKMDTGYDNMAESYGFVCSGCTENCCLTRFYHHTWLEYHYLHQGLQTLDDTVRREVIGRAFDVITRMNNAQPESFFGIMCPLNEDGRCRLYAYRPMICRLHGIPHELHHPVKGVVRGSGCLEFTRQCGKRSYVPFDRTVFYRELAELEKNFRLALSLEGKIKMTIAEIITLDWTN